ncbi:MAG TPA: 23S rRNA (uracil(1939)-C(5))-methyltransferase RlmD [Rhabdochlamydiaceae bacterium]
MGPSVEIIGGLPGDILEVELGPKRRRKRQGRLLRVLRASGMRREPRCMHVPYCGGCAWQQMDYGAQLGVKEGWLRELFGEEAPIRPIIPCEEPWQYRNKMEFSFSQNKAGERFLGLVLAGSRGHVWNIGECHLVSPWFMTVLEAVRKWWAQSGLEAYRRDDTGSLRTLTVREGKNTGDKLILLTVSGNPAFGWQQRHIKGFVEAVEGAVGRERVSIFLRIQQACKGSQTQFYEMHLSGPDHLLEKCRVGGREFTFKISPSSFFQPNTAQAERLYSAALEMISGVKEHILDLYAGIGTLGIVCSERAKQVTAIELNPYAVFDGESNKEINGITHCRMVRGDVGKALQALRQEEGFVLPDLVIVDPPRSGLDKEALAHLAHLGPEEILYISCNPATQAANIHELAKAGYILSALQPVDQFPHTVHLEAIALLRRRL